MSDAGIFAFIAFVITTAIVILFSIGMLIEYVGGLAVLLYAPFAIGGLFYILARCLDWIEGR